MHENLKYTLKFNEDTIPLEKTSLLDPNNKKSDFSEKERIEIADWQPIYADKHYGTHYFVYAKFIGKKEGEGFEVNLIQFYLQNYSGSVSIGLTNQFQMTSVKDDNDPDFLDPRYPKRKKILLEIGLQGLNNNYTKLDYTPDNFIINDGDLIQVSGFFIPVDSNISKIYDNTQIHNALFVDDLFMDRNGDEIFITSIGEKKLRHLANFSLIESTKLQLAGIELNAEQENVPGEETRGRIMPCSPHNSICYIE